MSSSILNPASGTLVEVFVRIENGYVDAICRAADQSAWEAAALANALLVQTDDGLVATAGASIDVLGPVELAPAVFNEAGDLITPATFDDRYHVNLRLREDLNWQPIALAWTLQGAPDEQVNRDEEAVVLAGVSLIDPDSISTPARVWA